ncbi:MAG: chemotaxis protein CheD [Polyangiaceae bacterium]
MQPFTSVEPIQESSVELDAPTRIHLGVGDVHVAEVPTVAWTVLGSCVAIIFFAPSRQISALCHAQLPVPLDKAVDCREGCPHPCFRRARTSTNLKFVTCSVDYMLAKLHSIGVSKQDVACALVGGANVINVSSAKLAIGTQNVVAAKSVLEEHAIRIRYENVGGAVGRTVTYHTATGRLHVRPSSEVGRATPRRPGP